MSDMKEAIGLVGSVCSILGFVIGFFSGRPYWKKKGIQMAQRQAQQHSTGAWQEQEQHVSN